MFPNATIPERIADGTVHTIGVLGALTGAIMLLMWASGMVSVGVMIALAIYGIALIATFAASATNNMMPFDGPRPMLRRIDHAACDDDRRLVCLFHPCNRLGLGRDRHHLEAVFWQKPGRYEPALYLVIGWLSVFFDLGTGADCAHARHLADRRRWSDLHGGHADLRGQIYAIFDRNLARVCCCGLCVFLCHDCCWHCGTDLRSDCSAPSTLRRR